MTTYIKHILESETVYIIAVMSNISFDKYLFSLGVGRGEEGIFFLLFNISQVSLFWLPIFVGYSVCYIYM